MMGVRPDRPRYQPITINTGTNMKKYILTTKLAATLFAAFALAACQDGASHGHSHDEPAASVAAASAAVSPQAPAGADAPARNDEMRVTLKPNQGTEVKLTMAKGAQVAYTWKTVDGLVNHDTHGEPASGPANVVHRYKKEVQVAGDQGALVAPFAGEHGWFWRNRSDKDVTIVLSVKGQYQDIKQKK